MMNGFNALQKQDLLKIYIHFNQIIHSPTVSFTMNHPFPPGKKNISTFSYLAKLQVNSDVTRTKVHVDCSKGP